MVLRTLNDKVSTTELHAQSSNPNESFVPCYGTRRLSFSHGRGLRITDMRGKEYLDFGSGIAVNIFGHGDEELVNAILDQAKKMIHCSNLYLSEPSIRLSSHLTTISGLQRVFFSNSGTEANEAGIKFILKRFFKMKAHDHGLHRAPRIICFEGSFHGRTLGALSATSSRKYRDPFEPLFPIFEFVPYGDLDQIEAALQSPADAIIAEPIQGEGGVRCAPEGFFPKLDQIRSKTGTLLMLDEVQCGLGRLGTLFAFERVGARPDIVTLAKPLAGGLPLGATLMKEEIAQFIEAGDHGTTFGGNPVSCAAAYSVLRRLQERDIPAHVKKLEATLDNVLRILIKDFPNLLSGHRGMGLLWGIDTKLPAGEFVKIAEDLGLLLLTAGAQTIRIAPPLIVREEEILEFDELFRMTLRHLQ